MSQVIIGMDPHKRSATIEVMASDETVVGGGRYATDAAGYRAMLAEVARWPERTWVVEGCQGIGRHIANRLLADGQDVADVPPKLSAWTRVFATGQGRKTDATDAHSVALAATRKLPRGSVRAMSWRSSDQADCAAQVRTAVMTISATSLGWEIMTTCEAPSISVTVAPIRL